MGMGDTLQGKLGTSIQTLAIRCCNGTWQYTEFTLENHKVDLLKENWGKKGKE